MRHRRTFLTLLLSCGAPAFALLMWRLSPFYGQATYDTDFLLYTIGLPLLPFWIMAIALRTRRRNGEWRFDTRIVQWLSVVVAAPVALMNAWWYAYYGEHVESYRGVDFALGCLTVLLPVAIPLIMILGLALAAETARHAQALERQKNEWIAASMPVPPGATDLGHDD